MPSQIKSLILATAVAIPMASYASTFADAIGVAVLITAVSTAMKPEPEPRPILVFPSYRGEPTPYVRPLTITEPKFIPEPPRFDIRTNQYIYKQPMAYDRRTNEWFYQSDVYIPAEKHYVGCNYYDYFDAWACIEKNDRLRK